MIHIHVPEVCIYNYSIIISQNYEKYTIRLSHLNNETYTSL